MVEDSLQNIRKRLIKSMDSRLSTLKKSPVKDPGGAAAIHRTYQTLKSLKMLDSSQSSAKTQDPAGAGSNQQRSGAVLWFLRRNAPMPDDTLAREAATDRRSSLGKTSDPGLEDSDADEDKTGAVNRNSALIMLQPSLNKESSGGRRGAALSRGKMKQDERMALAAIAEARREGSKQRGSSAASDRQSDDEDRPRAKWSPKRPPLIKRRVPKDGGSPTIGPHRQFLHQALLSIGAEVDEATVVPLPGSFSARTPGATPVSVDRRVQLRDDFAEYTDNEYAKLMKQVEEKERQISLLRAREKQLKRQLDNTRVATIRRNHRLKLAPPLSPSRNDSQDPSLAGAHSAKPQFFNNSSSSSAAPSASAAREGGGSRVVGFASDESQQLASGQDSPSAASRAQVTKRQGATNIFEAPSSKDDPDNEEYLTLMLTQVEVEANLKQVYEDTCKAYKNMIVSRRIIEATLLGTHAQVLQLRSRVMKNEARTTLLANELRKVLQSMPEVIERTLTRIKEARETQRGKDVEQLKKKYEEESYKFLDQELLVEKRTVVAEDVELVQEACDQAKSIVTETRAESKHLLKLAEEMDEALYAIRDAWLLVPMHFPNDLKPRSGDHSISEDGQMLVSKSTAAARSLKELLRQLAE
eukprot:TRINITY_DN20385_c0_g1_i1.p1 TRINITY_DN20385_c0_g1~~TRINITY_DN20385_c0_g1_i1.p1  ORF type:complete len:640 (-),score=167.40 TRINITY_DN20385_c0_g1_i1:211-2130(-)